MSNWRESFPRSCDWTIACLSALKGTSCLELGWLHSRTVQYVEVRAVLQSTDLTNHKSSRVRDMFFYELFSYPPLLTSL